jgi:hypothetical protein
MARESAARHMQTVESHHHDGGWKYKSSLCGLNFDWVLKNPRHLPNTTTIIILTPSHTRSGIIIWIFSVRLRCDKCENSLRLCVSYKIIQFPSFLWCEKCVCLCAVDKRPNLCASVCFSQKKPKCVKIQLHISMLRANWICCGGQWLAWTRECRALTLNCFHLSSTEKWDDTHTHTRIYGFDEDNVVKILNLPQTHAWAGMMSWFN